MIHCKLCNEVQYRVLGMKHGNEEVLHVPYMLVHGIIPGMKHEGAKLKSKIGLFSSHFGRPPHQRSSQRPVH